MKRLSGLACYTTWMAAAHHVALVLRAPISLCTLATVAIYEATLEGQEGAANSKGTLLSSSITAPVGYQPKPAEVESARQFSGMLGALKLCESACVLLSAGRAHARARFSHRKARATLFNKHPVLCQAGGLHLVGCAKGHVAKVYKALAAATLPGGKLAGLAKLPPVKQSICLSLPPQIACSIIRKELESTLLRSGWAAFTDDMLLGVLSHTHTDVQPESMQFATDCCVPMHPAGHCFLSAAAGEVWVGESVKLEVQIEPPGSIIVFVQTGVVCLVHISSLKVCHECHDASGIINASACAC